MNLKLESFDWNRYALASTGFFTVYLLLESNLIPQLPHCLSYLACPPWYHELRLTLVSAAYVSCGFAGLKASRLFGGRENFTGRLLFYFSLFLFAYGPIVQILNYLDSLPNPLSDWFSYNVLLPYSGIDIWWGTIAYFLPACALVVCLRSVWDGFDLRSWLIVFLSSGFGLFLAWFSFLYYDPAGGFTTFADAVLNVWVTPFVIFLQVAAGGLLWRTLGRWYVAKAIRALIATYLFLGVVAATIIGTVIFTWLAGLGSASSASSLNLDVPWYVLTTFWRSAFYLFGLVLTQIRPRTTGRYY